MTKFNKRSNQLPQSTSLSYKSKNLHLKPLSNS